jgi:hypothetical protein
LARETSHPTNLAQLPNSLQHSSPQSQKETAHYTGTIADTVEYLHQTLFSPVLSTLLKAIDKGNFATWPMLTRANVTKHLPKSEATPMGHLDQKRKNIQSTKRIPTPTQPPIHQTSERTHQTYVDLLDINETTGKIFSDQTGQFPVQSSQGNKYVMIIYDYDSNAILVEAMQSRSEHEMIRAYESIHTHLEQRGLKPKL